MLSMPKVKKVTVTSAKKKAWTAFSLYIRHRDGKRDELFLDGEQAYCITCSKPYPITGLGCLQAGHFIPGRNNQVLFDERQVHAQCYNCNVNLKGNWVPYLAKMRELYGEETVQDMLDNHKGIKKYSVPELQEIEQEFKQKLAKLLDK